MLLLQMINASSRDDIAAEAQPTPEVAAILAAAAGHADADFPTRLWQLAAKIPRKYAVWLHLVINQLLVPDADLIAHISGACAGIAYVHVTPLLAGPCRAALRTLRRQPSVPAAPGEQERERRRGRRWRKSLVGHAVAIVSLFVVGGTLSRFAKEQRQHNKHWDGGDCVFHRRQ